MVQGSRISVTVSVFLICGAFLLTGVTFLKPAEAPPVPQSASRLARDARRRCRVSRHVAAL